MARRPLFLDIARELRQQIVSGACVSGDRFAGDHELARRFEVSVVTVRQALTALSQEGLITRRQGSGTFVASRSSRPIAIYSEQNVFLPTTSRWHVYVMGYLRRFFDERGLASRPFVGRREMGTVEEANLPDHLIEPTCGEFLEAVAGDQISSVVAIATPLHPQWTKPLGQRGVPIVGTSSENACRVSTDRWGGLSRTLDYFQALGCQRIAMVYWAGYAGSHRYEAMAQQFTQLMRERGLAVHPQWLRGDLFPTTTGAGWEEFREIWTTSREKPDALIVGDDCLLADVEATIHEMGIRVSDQLAVASFTNRHVAVPTRFPLARIEMDPEPYAQALGNMLLDVMSGKQSQPCEKIMPVKWIEPASKMQTAEVTGR